MRVAKTIELDEQTQRELRMLTQRKRIEVRLQQRARIVLLAAQAAGYTSLAPYFVIDGAERTIVFLEKVFGAQRLRRHDAPDGRVGHAEVRIDDTVLMLADGLDGWPPMPANVHVYVKDVDAVFRAAIAAGADEKGRRRPAWRLKGRRSRRQPHHENFHLLCSICDWPGGHNKPGSTIMNSGSPSSRSITQDLFDIVERAQSPLPVYRPSWNISRSSGLSWGSYVIYPNVINDATTRSVYSK